MSGVVKLSNTYTQCFRFSPTGFQPVSFQQVRSVWPHRAIVHAGIEKT
jgi:hypothetical protein